MDADRQADTSVSAEPTWGPFDVRRPDVSVKIDRIVAACANKTGQPESVVREQLEEMFHQDRERTLLEYFGIYPLENS